MVDVTLKDIAEFFKLSHETGAYLIEGGLNGGTSAPCQPDTEPLKKIIFSMAAFIALVVAARYLLYLILQFGRLLAATAGTPIAALAANSLRSVLAAIPALVTAEAQAKGAPAGNYDECSCQENFERCLSTKLADVGWDFGSNRCRNCFVACRNNDGVWPLSIPVAVSPTGFGSCEYGLFE